MRTLVPLACALLSSVLVFVERAETQSSRATAPAPEVRGFVIDNDRCFDVFSTPAAVMELQIGLTFAPGGGAQSAYFEIEDRSVRRKLSMLEWLSARVIPGRRFVAVVLVDERERQVGWRARCIVERPIVSPDDLTFSEARRDPTSPRRTIREATLSAAARDRIADSVGHGVMFLAPNDVMVGQHTIHGLLENATFPLELP